MMFQLDIIINHCVSYMHIVVFRRRMYLNLFLHDIITDPF